MGRKSSVKRLRSERREMMGEPETRDVGESTDAATAGRIREVERELTRLSKGAYESSAQPGFTPGERLSYLEDILAFESVESGTSLFQGLEENGVKLPRPEALSESRCRRKVLEILKALGNLGVFLIGWEHMSPRELYSTLWHQTLWEGCYIERKFAGGMTLIDVSRSIPREEMKRFLEDLRGASRVH
jgi:hypothetical protein